jgi:hypothetical protein
VTVWQQQTATVQIPVNTMSWSPETRTVQVPTTTYRTVEAIVSRIPIQVLPGGPQQMMAGAGAASPGAAPSGPTATLAATAGPMAPIAARASSTGGAAAAPMNSAAPLPATYGGQVLSSDPPRQSTAWQPPTPDRYGDAMRR